MLYHNMTAKIIITTSHFNKYIMKFKFSLALVALVLTLATVACKKKADEVSAPLDPNTGLQQTGSFIKGTVTTKNSNDQDVSMTFEHTYQRGVMTYYGNPGATAYSSASMYKDFTGYSGNYADYSNIRYALDTINDPTPSNIRLNFYGRKQVKPSEDFYFEFYGDAAKTVITNYVYSAANKTMSGNFTVTASTSTNNSKAATITGSFLLTNVRQNQR
jgi:hypothetical protein